jgi:broad specificity phosphatase PhoE
MLPRNVVYTRHGESTRNRAGREAYENGNLAGFEEIVNKPSSMAPLSEPTGVEQARITGGWFLTQPFNFRRFYVSTMLRAQQTAGLINPPGADWRVENNLRERSAGVMEDMMPDERRTYLEQILSRGHVIDPYNFRPKNGESYADVFIRRQLFMGTLHRMPDDSDVLIVDHGDCMWVSRGIHERWTPEDFMREREAGNGVDNKISNCMVLHYTRVNPDTGEESEYPEWVRTCTPWQDPVPSPWRKIVRRTYTSAELLVNVQRALDRIKALFPGRSIPVVRVHGVDVDRVQFPAARQNA